MELPPLTRRQRLVFEFIVESVEKRNMPPTLREIGAYMSIRSTNGVGDHLRAIERKGYIAVERGGVARGIRVLARPATPDVSERTGGQRLVPVVASPRDSKPLFAVAADGLRVQHPDLALVAFGDSMSGAGIVDGDLLFVRRYALPKEGSLVVADLGERPLVRTHHRRQTLVQLRAAKEGVPTVMIEAKDFRPDMIVGVVTGVFRSIAASAPEVG